MHVFKLEEETFVIHMHICVYFAKQKATIMELVLETRDSRRSQQKVNLSKTVKHW